MRPVGRRQRCRAPAALSLLISWLVFWIAAGAAGATGTVPVGGAPSSDLASDVVGRRNRDEILKALEEIYAKHPCNSTSLGLHARNSSGDSRTNANADTKRTSDGLATRSSSVAIQGDEKLIIAVPRKPGFENFVSSAIYIFNTTVRMLQDPPDYELCAFNGTYDELVSNVSERVFDGAVGDVTITDERAKVVDFTTAYAPSGLALLVLTDVEPPIQWIFLKPLTKELWITTVGFFFFTGFVVWKIEAPRNPDYQGSILRKFITAWYFIFSTLTFSHGQTLRSPLSKISVVIWCFTVLVLVQSYAANLSSILTTKRLLTDLDQLVHSQNYIGYQGGGFVRSMLMKEGVPRSRLRAYNSETEYDDALRKGSSNGGVKAIVDEVPFLSYFLSDSERNKDFNMIDLQNTTLGFGFVFPKGTNFVKDLSDAITNMDQGSPFKEASTGSKNKNDTDSVRLTLRSFSGLFIVTGSISTLMLLISVTRSIYAMYTRVRGSESQSADDDGGSVRLQEFSAPQNDTGNGSVLDQHIQEVRDNDSQGARGSGESTGDEQAGVSAMQDSLSNGSVPEVSVHIEMASTGQGVGRPPYTAIPPNKG